MSDPITLILVSELSKSIRKALSRKHSVNIDYVLSGEIELEFSRCLNMATDAFLGSFQAKYELNNSQKNVVVEYLKSAIVSQEISHLLDPGIEYFDRGKLVQAGHSALQEHFAELTSEIILDSWDEFLKAFSFASRSTPHLREFLRASYEAGSFRSLSNIEDVLEKMEATIGEITQEEMLAKQSIREYLDELKGYKNWAIGYLATTAS
jgi:hypothetical protein